MKMDKNLKEILVYVYYESIVNKWPKREWIRLQGKQCWYENIYIPSYFGLPLRVAPIFKRFHIPGRHLLVCKNYLPLQNGGKVFQLYPFSSGWSGGAKVLCILHHWGVQLILACSWARPAILVVGKGRGGMFLFLLFLHFHSCSSFFPVPLFHLLYSLFYLFSPFLWETTQNDPQGLTCR